MAQWTSTLGSVVKTVVSWLRIIRSRLRSQIICKQVVSVGISLQKTVNISYNLHTSPCSIRRYQYAKKCLVSLTKSLRMNTKDVCSGSLVSNHEYLQAHLTY